VNDEFDYKFDLLKQEIDAAQQGIRTYDNILFVIKGWAITIFAAFVVFATQADEPRYILLCLLSVMMFWLIDVTFKIIQRIYRARYVQIEKYLQSDEFSLATKERSFKDFRIPDLDSGFHVRREYLQEILRATLTPNTSIPYVVMTILTISLYFGMTKWGP
jgi:hypothetical protein